MKNPNTSSVDGKSISDIPLKEREKSAQNYEEHIRKTTGWPEKKIQAEVNEFRAQWGLPSLDELSLAQKMRAWIELQSGTFRNRDIIDELNIDKNKKNLVSTYLARFVEEGLITKDGRASGYWRRIETELERIDFRKAEDNLIEIVWPFGLEKMVEIRPGNIVVIAGSPNSGKTAFLLDFISRNMHKFNIHYFNSEMGAGELSKRLKLFEEIDSPVPFSEWNFEAYARNKNFADIIVPGEGNINIIDYIEMYEEFYLVSKHLSEIHNKLNGAVGIVSLQKNPGTETGLGGYRSLEKPRLYLAMDSNILRIVKAKNWKGSDNPNRKQIHFKLVKGCKFITQDRWSLPENEGSH